MSVSSDTCELFDDEDDINSDTVMSANCGIADIDDDDNYARDDTHNDTYDDAHNYKYNDTHDDMRNDTADDSTQPADRADAYRSFLTSVFSDESAKYAFDVWLGDATARALPTDGDECLTACAVCDDDVTLTTTLLWMFPNYLNGFSWSGYSSELMQPADGQLEKSDILSLTLDGLRHSNTTYDLIVADATTLRYGDYDCLIGEQTSPDDYMPLVDECLRHSKFSVALLPEAFARNDAAHARCSDIILPMCQLSPDVSFHICIALFSPYETDDVKIWNGFDAMHSGTV